MTSSFRGNGGHDHAKCGDVLLCICVMQEKEMSEILLRNTELNIVNSDLQKQLDELNKVRVFITKYRNYYLAVLQGHIFNATVILKTDF